MGWIFYRVKEIGKKEEESSWGKKNQMVLDT